MYIKKKVFTAKQKRKALNVAVILLVGIFIYSTSRMIFVGKQYSQSKDSYSGLNQYMTFDPGETGTPGDTGNISGMDGGMTEVEIGKYIRLQQLGANFASLREINGDVVGWIEIAGTALNYPVTQCSNNDYYLNHLFTGEYNICGCPFLDYRTSSGFDSRNNIIYGHRMNDGSMFTCIQNYSSQSFYNNNPTATLYTPTGTYVIEFFSGYVSAARGEPWKVTFSSDDAFQQWHDNLIEKSDFTSDVSFSVSDCVVTLSTCSHAFENARYVLHGVLREV
ncbi:MAG: class B sortase [Oscillospiraceae bacterium]|nr:class B sortase [Oscillospiraceae bacterium]